jgi:tripartite-type tricarboxylate transporter receptor subunit TctC
VWYAVLAPAGTPREIVAKLNTEIVRVLNEPQYHKILVDAAITPVGSTPDELAQYIRKEIVKWAKVVKESGARID